MILQALEEYYRRKTSDDASDIARFGWSSKELPFLINIKDSGELIGVEDTREGGKKKVAKTFLVSQEVKRSSGIRPNFLWDNVEYVSGEACKVDDKKASGADAVKKKEAAEKKHQAFLEGVAKYAGVPQINSVLKFLSNKNFAENLNKEESWAEAKKQVAFVSFKVNGKFIFDYPGVRKVVSEIAENRMEGNKGICLVSGDKTTIAVTHAAIKGVVGANTTGGNIVSFNFDAGCSYGKKQGLNSPVGESVAFAYTTALNYLLRKDSKQKVRVGDATAVFWAGEKNSMEEELSAFFSEPAADNPDALVEHVRALYNAVQDGSMAEDNGKTRFYVLGLSPNAARLSVRFWHVGTVAELQGKIADYFRDLEIVHAENEKDHLSMWRLLISTAQEGESKNVMNRLAGDFMNAILEGRPFPISLLQAVLLRCKAERKVDYPRAKLLKGYLNRKSKGSISMSLDKENTNIGYRLGRLFATLEKIQQEASPGLNATIRDRYYAAASTSPIRVFSNLLKLKNYHIEKLEDGRKVFFEKLVGEIMGDIDDFPSSLLLDDQGRFAIGYYHQKQDFFTKKNTDL